MKRSSGDNLNPKKIRGHQAGTSNTNATPQAQWKGIIMRFQRLLGILLSIVFFAAACGSGDNQSVNADAFAELTCEQAQEALNGAQTLLTQATSDLNEAPDTPARLDEEGAFKEAEQVVNGLKARLFDCSSEQTAATVVVAAPTTIAPPATLATTASTVAPSPSATAPVQTNNGDVVDLPLIDSREGEILSGIDALADPNSPSVFEQAKAEGPFTSWTQLVKVVEDFDLDWYPAEVNRLNSEGFISFNWDDVLKFAATEDEYGFTSNQVTVIQVYGNANSLSDEEVRAQAAEVVGDLADVLVINRWTGDDILVNTRGLKNEQLNKFVDPRSMVRVALTPIVYDENGTPVNRLADEGAFVDCLNIEAMKRPPPPPPVVTTPTTAPPTTVATTTPTTAPPSTVVVTVTTAPPSTTVTTAPPTTAPTTSTTIHRTTTSAPPTTAPTTSTTIHRTTTTMATTTSSTAPPTTAPTTSTTIHRTTTTMATTTSSTAPPTTAPTTTTSCTNKNGCALPTSTSNPPTTARPTTAPPTAPPTTERSIHQGSTSTISIPVSVIPDSGSGYTSSTIAPTTVAPPATQPIATTVTTSPSVTNVTFR